MKRTAVALTSVLLVAFAQSVLAQSAIETALQATVTIEVIGPDGLSHGSGFIASSDGMIITAAHVVDGATSAVVRLQNGEELNVEGVVTIDRDKDFAIVRVAGFDLPTVPLANADDVSVGQRVIVIGAPIDPTYAGTVSDGLVSSDRMMDGTRMLQISVPVSPGSSGGPVMTEQGEVIGLVVSAVTEDGAQNLNFALPINYVRGQLALASTRTLQPLAEVRVTATGGNAPVSTFGPATASNEYEELVLSYLDASYTYFQDALREEDVDVQSIFHSSLGALEESERETVFLTLPETEDFILTAVCDDDCSDVDLTLLDPVGNILDEDIAPDDTPITLVTTGGSVQVEVRMVTCSVEPCYYALGVFQVDDSSPREIAEQDPGSGAPATGQTLEVLRSRAEQGDARAQYNLGNMYADGDGVPEDDVEAVRWFRLAADQGLAEAQYNLGFLYATGEGVPEDDVEAVRWYRLAADQGLAEAQYNLGVLYGAGTGVTEDMSEAVRLYRLSADQGYALAQYNLGVMYAAGTGVTEDISEAVRLYRLSADQGYALAQYNLGVLYSNGEGVPQDDEEAVRWYRLGAEQGYAPAQSNLGASYDTGRGVAEDDLEAARLYRLAADQGLALAQYNLGFMYAAGKGVRQNDVLAYMWSNLAAAQGFEGAQGNKDIIEERMSREQIAEAQRMSREWLAAHPPGGN
jgi:TPR repeat protein